jgi:hypothetical protein
MQIQETQELLESEDTDNAPFVWHSSAVSELKSALENFQQTSNLANSSLPVTSQDKERVSEYMLPIRLRRILWLFT